MPCDRRRPVSSRERRLKDKMIMPTSIPQPPDNITSADRIQESNQFKLRLKVLMFFSVASINVALIAMFLANP